MRAEKWDYWKTGFYYYETRITNRPVFYINRKKGYTTVRYLRQATKFKTEKSAREHPLSQFKDTMRLCLQPSRVDMDTEDCD